MKSKSKLVNGFIITTFVSLYLMVSVISTIHVIDFFKLSNPTWLAISLAIAFEVGAAASLASLIAMEKMNKSLVWFLFILLTAMQAMGNTYYAFVNLGDYTSWSELFGLIEEEEIFQKRVLSIVSGAILPIVALGFIKSLVDYIKPEKEEESTDGEVTDDQSDLTDIDQSEDEDISEPLIYDSALEMNNIPGGKLELESSSNKEDEIVEDFYGSESIDTTEANKSDNINEVAAKPIADSNVEIVNANANRRIRPKVIEMPENPDINPTRL